MHISKFKSRKLVIILSIGKSPERPSLKVSRSGFHAYGGGCPVSRSGFHTHGDGQKAARLWATGMICKIVWSTDAFEKPL